MSTSKFYFKQLILLISSLMAFHSIDAQIVISGIITSDVGDPLAEVPVSITGTIEETIFSTSDGYYEFTVPENGNYVITPCASSNFLNGVTTLDRVIVSRHLEGIQLLDSPYKVIAADVDQDDVITGQDTVVINQLILGQIPDFPNNKSWRFISRLYEFSDPTNPFLNDFPEVSILNNLSSDVTINFIGIKLGDVNNSAISTIGNTATNCDGSPISSTSEYESIQDLTAFPNPFTDEINIELGKEFSSVKIELYSAAGNKLSNYNFKSTGEINLNLEDWAAGIYFIKVVADEKIGWESVIKK